ncbi:MAG TPA: hypothetical protein VMO17_01185 [Terriglobia bacterium]|nr:hypothetical protein [Terriglobia bacterium]
MKAKILVLLLTCLLPASMVAPLYAQQPQGDNPNVDEITVPEGTEFKLQLHTTVNSATSKAGDRIMCSLIDPVAVEDRDVLPKGVRIDGHVGESREAGRKGKGGYLTIVFDTVELPNGQKAAILGSLTEVFSSESGSDPNVGPEGELKGKGPDRKVQALMVIAPAAVGAVGGVGTAITLGAVGIMTALFLPKGRQASLGAGSLIGMRLDRDVTLVIPSAGK